MNNSNILTEKPDYVTDENPRCSCGHLIKNHTINMKKTMKTSMVYGKCNFCSCVEVCLE